MNYYNQPGGNNIVSHNMKIIENELFALLMGESVGGNAHTYKDVPCAGANFVFEHATGKILQFGNSQNLDSKHIHAGTTEALYRVCFYLQNIINLEINFNDTNSYLQKMLIVGIRIESKGKVSILAQKNLTKTAKLFNQLYSKGWNKIH